MDQETQTPAPDHERRLTLYRFCAQHKLSLSTLQRIAIGQELTKGLERNNLYNLTCMRPRSEGRGDTRLYNLFRAGP